MAKHYKVNFRNIKTIEFPEGTTFKEIAEHFKLYFDYEPLIAKVDNDICDLSSTIKKNCTIDFYDRSTPVGNEVYRRSLKFVLLMAIKNILGKDEDMISEYSVDNGVYCTLKDKKITKEQLNEIKKEMNEIIKHDYIFTKLSVSRMDAIKYFKKHKRYDKVNVLKYISNTYINLYRINDIYDYFYGKLAYSTKQLDNFKLTYLDENGFILSIPTTFNPEKTLEYKHYKKVFEKFIEYNNWGKILGVETAADLNSIVSKSEIGQLINLSEAYYNSQLTHIADEISESKNSIKLILIAGPSSSGKTTTSKKLDIYLRSRGYITHSISLDDYFLDLDKRPLDENGNPDFESVRALDVDLFNKKISALLNGEKVNMPRYNFLTCKREYNNNYLQLGEKDIIIVEGLHALNDTLTESIKKSQKYKIYISPLTQISIDNHNHSHTTDVRKIRRIIRDSKTRGYTASDTLTRWPDIQKGERNNIYRFQDDADMVINSSLIYELGVLKTYVEPLLFNVSESDEVYIEALRLINFLRNFLPIPSDDVPADSVLREFIGGSCFND